MKISIKNIKDRKTFDIDVEPTFTAADVKAKVEAQEGMPANAQRLIFGGKPLRDGATLAELGIQKAATLHRPPPQDLRRV